MKGLFWTGVVAGLTFWFGSGLSLPFPMLVAWKGAGVALLSLWAGLRARGQDGRLLAALLACGALGDVLLEAIGMQAGAAAFLVGHGLAIRLYLGNRDRLWRWPLFLLVPAIAILSVWLSQDRAVFAPVALYSVVLATMAVVASHSRFRGAALGAWSFVASDLLIFGSLGRLASSFVPDLLIWPLYFAGQTLIAWDVARRLCERADHEAVHDRVRERDRR